MKRLMTVILYRYTADGDEIELARICNDVKSCCRHFGLRRLREVAKTHLDNWWPYSIDTHCIRVLKFTRRRLSQKGYGFDHLDRCEAGHGKRRRFRAPAKQRGAA